MDEGSILAGNCRLFLSSKHLQNVNLKKKKGMLCRQTYPENSFNESTHKRLRLLVLELGVLVSYFYASEPFGSSIVADICCSDSTLIVFLISQRTAFLYFFICSGCNNVKVLVDFPLYSSGGKPILPHSSILEDAFQQPFLNRT